MKDYKIKEALCNLKQIFDQMKEKFDVMIEILAEMEADKLQGDEDAIHEDTAELQHPPR